MRNYSSIASEKTLADPLTSSGSTVQVSDINGFPAVPFTLVLEPDTIKEEIVTVTAIDGTQLTLSRGEEGTTAVAHDEGSVARHMITARDLQYVQDHMESTESVHGISDTSFLVYENSSQTLTNKQLTNPKVNENVAVTATATELNLLDGAIVTTTELNYVSGVTSAIQTQIANVIASLASAVPTGTVSMFAGTEAPTGYLFCNGAAVSRTTYSALFAKIGTNYGAGDNSTTFNLPDLRGRAPIGAGTGRNVADSANLTTRSLGAKVSDDEQVTLTIAQMPKHKHILQFGTGVVTSGSYVPITANSFSNEYGTEAGGDQPHNNMQPSTVVNFIIKH
jgi:microcystin-dependent protein